MIKLRTLVPVAALVAGTAFGADTKELNAEGSALMQEKAWAAAAEKFVAAALAQPAEPRQLSDSFDQALKTLGKQNGTNNLVTVEALAQKALAVPGLSTKSRIKIQLLRIPALARAGHPKEAQALVKDLVDARVDLVATIAAGAEAANAGKVGRDAYFDYIEQYLRNPARYGLDSAEQRRQLLAEYAGIPRAWGGDVLDRTRLERAEEFSEKLGLEKITPMRLKEMREMDIFPLPEAELGIPNDLSGFGIDPNRKVVHAKDFGWNPTNVTACLTAALNSDASMIVVDDMGTPWYTGSVKISKKTGSNKQIVFKKGVKVHAVTVPDFVKGNLFDLQDASNVVFIAEGQLGKDVYIGQFPSRKARFATGISYGGSGFGGKGSNVLLKNIWSANNLDDGFCMSGKNHFLVDCLLDDNFRQGLSLVGSIFGVYKNVTFCRTVGGEPHNGVDMEPPYEVYSCPHHYFLGCKFFDNAAGNVVLSTSTYSPTTLYFKDCEFEAGRYRNFSTLARLGIYTGPVQKAPSKIIFENCRLDGYADAPALLWNSMIFDMTFRKCVFNDQGHLDPTRKPNMSPILLSLDRGYWDGFYPKAGVVDFEDCTFNGWEGKPLIAVADHNGKVGINTFRGIVNHNGKQVDLSKFSYLPPERSYQDAADPDLQALSVAPAASFEPAVAVDFSAPWYHPMPCYGYLVRGEKGQKATLRFEGIGKYAGWTFTMHAPSGATRKVGKLNPGENALELAFEETGVHEVWGEFASDGSEHVPTYKFLGSKGTPVAVQPVLAGNLGRRQQLQTPVDKPRAVGYFEVPANTTCNFKISDGGLEIFDETGKSLIRLDNGDYFGTQCFSLRTKTDAIWSFRALTPLVRFRMFAPLSGIWAEQPEMLPTTKPGLKFTKVEAIPAPELKDEPPLPLPAKYAEEVAQLAAQRLAEAKTGLAAKRLAEAEASLAKMKSTPNPSDGLKREIDDVTHTVQRLSHHAKAEADALKETEEERQMAAVCVKWAVTTVPEMMWCCSLKDGVFTYPDVRTLRSVYNEIVRRLGK